MNPLILLQVLVSGLLYLLSERLTAVGFALEPLTLVTIVFRVVEAIAVDLSVFECSFVKFLAVMELPVANAMDLSRLVVLTVS